MSLLCLSKIAVWDKSIFLYNTPTEACRKGSHSFLQKEKSVKSSCLLSLFPLLPLSSELWICLEVQVMMPVLNGPWSLGQVQRYRKLVSEADEKMMLSILLPKEFKLCGFIEIQRWEPRGKYKIVPWPLEDTFFVLVCFSCWQINFTQLYLTNN